MHKETAPQYKQKAEVNWGNIENTNVETPSTTGYGVPSLEKFPWDNICV